MAKIAVVGSINMDLVVETDVIPRQGETILGKNFFATSGGKGANQAVASARLGGEVALFGSVGNDQNGESMLEVLKKEKVGTSHINIVDGVPTGVAIIEICNSDNRIIVVPGANEFTNIGYLSSICEELLNYDVILMQHEIPLKGIAFITNYLSNHNKTIILNPAPAFPLTEEIINEITYITPNEHEYKIILNTTDNIEEAVKNFPNKLLITRGDEGVTYFDGNSIVTVPCIDVNVVDTTGAGDTFTGAFGVAISEGQPIKEAIQFANIAAGLSITKKGAQGGMPTREDVLKMK